MPQISKIRIVNFQYNDGNRLIADELYNLEGTDQKPSDVLINLANGGGKSVLVQLMMQPIIPKARVAGRKIESFFTKASDHCYVVIEWAKDGSQEKLLTGIAMAASDSAADTDSDRGFQIKYYTFLSEYQNNQGNYTIAGLPLSKKENGRFIPATFDEVRNLAKKSAGKLERYSSDDSTRWRDRLSQFGIVQNEWHMIEKLNSNEDGLSKFFSSLKSSDAVIDELIIPRIEEKQSHAVSKDDSSLETMLLSYAKQFSNRQEIIKEHDLLNGFLHMLTEARGDAEKLWNDNDSLEKCIEMLFAYRDALQAEISEQREKKKQLEDEQRELDESIRHIRWEKASDEYYVRKQSLEQTAAELENAEDARQKAEEKLEAAKKRVHLLECAYYFLQQQELESQLSAITEEIIRRESNTESADRLASLRYSACRAIETEQKRIAPQLKMLSGERDSVDENIRELEGSMASLAGDIDRANTEKIRADAKWESQKKEDDRIVEELGISAMRMFDSRYEEDALKSWRTDAGKRQQAASDRIEAAKNEIARLEKRAEAIPGEIAKAEIQIEHIQESLKTTEGCLAEYRAAEEKVTALYRKYTLDVSLLFTEHAVNYLKEQKANTNASIADAQRKTEAIEEAVASVKRGTLHIPKLLTDYLDQTGIHYISVEKYLLAQQGKHMSIEDCRHFLESYPFAAYGVILDPAAKEMLLMEADEEWLPALLPVFTDADIEGMLHGEDRTFAAVAAYSKKYFANSAAYAAELQEKLNAQCDHRRKLEERREYLDADLALAESFRVFDAGWEAQKLSEMKKLETDMANAQKRLVSLRAEQTAVRENIRNQQGEENRCNADVNRIQSQLNTFEKLLGRLQEETVLEDKLNAAERRLQDCKKQQEKKKTEKERKSEQRRKIQERLESLQIEAQSLQEGLEIVSGAPEAALAAGEWRSLLEEYKQLQSSQDMALQQLNKEKARLQKDIGDKEKEIGKRGCIQSEYEHLVFSEALEKNAAAEEKNAEAAYQNAETVHSNAIRPHEAAKTKYENACEQLKEFGGEALPMSKVGKVFADRIADANRKKTEIHENIQSVEKSLLDLQRVSGEADSAVGQYVKPLKWGRIALETDYVSQLHTILRKIQEWRSAVAAGKRKQEDILKEMSSAYSEDSADIRLAVLSMQNLLRDSDHAIRGDRFYTYLEHINANIHTAELRISQINTDLEEVNRTKDDLVRQCMIQGRQMYDGLRQLAGNSKIRVQEKRRQMLKFDIPDAVDENIAYAAIAAEIEKGTQEIADRTAEDSYAESEVRKIAARTVGSRRLLRRFIGAENIVLRAYKIDRNPDNSGYRSWEQTQVNNSGAEKFVVYFAVILALMAYTRDDADRGNDRSVLILDNPFGPISSRHVLEPMFEISRTYHVQMICLSDISKSDIVSCFSLVIRAVVKRFALSSREQLTHEGNEAIEHGFYRAEQLTLF